MDKGLACAATTQRGRPCKLPACGLWARVPFCWRHSPRRHYEREWSKRLCGALHGFDDRLAEVERLMQEESPDGE
jgi:hypothetical protein